MKDRNYTISPELLLTFIETNNVVKAIDEKLLSLGMQMSERFPRIPPTAKTAVGGIRGNRDQRNLEYKILL